MRIGTVTRELRLEKGRQIEGVAGQHGLAVLPRSAAGPAGVPLTAPHLVHRVELLASGAVTEYGAAAIAAFTETA